MKDAATPTTARPAEGYIATDFHQGWLAYRPGIHAALEAGQIEGVRFRVLGMGSDIEPGDTYIAERHSGMKLLTCRDHDRENGWVFPVERAYAFNTGECVKIALDA